MLALVRTPDVSLVDCELTHIERNPIDAQRAKAQHAAYCASLAKLGVKIISLPELPGQPDGVFVEDTVLVLDELAVLLRPRGGSRLGEVESVAPALKHFRVQIFSLSAPASMDGGDLLPVGRKIFVGISSRTNAEGARQLAALLAPFGYEVVTMPVRGCLHLKTAVTYLGRGALLINPAWVDGNVFRDYELIEIHPREPFSANALRLGSTILCAAEHPKVIAILRAQGFEVAATPISELAKAEAGLTCLSVLFQNE